jgi:hypothetical protein
MPTFDMHDWHINCKKQSCTTTTSTKSGQKPPQFFPGTFTPSVNTHVQSGKRILSESEREEDTEVDMERSFQANIRGNFKGNDARCFHSKNSREEYRQQRRQMRDNS